MEKLKAKYGVGEELIQLYYHPYIYLNRELIKEKDIDQNELERTISNELMKVKGIATAIPSSDLRSNNLADTPLNRKFGEIFIQKDPAIFIWFRNPTGFYILMNHFHLQRFTDHPGVMIPMSRSFLQEPE